jgi:hypothetical protein
MLWERVGQTGSGKTYTMGTDGMVCRSPEQFGVVPRIACDVFDACKQMPSVSVTVSALEIYGEELRDLISDDAKQRLQIREHPSGQITVVGLQEVTVSTKEEIMKVLGKGTRGCFSKQHNTYRQFQPATTHVQAF